MRLAPAISLPEKSSPSKKAIPRPMSASRLAGGVIVTSSITNEAVDDLGLKVGDNATAIIKASDMMVGK